MSKAVLKDAHSAYSLFIVLGDRLPDQLHLGSADVFDSFATLVDVEGGHDLDTGFLSGLSDFFTISLHECDIFVIFGHLFNDREILLV